MKVAIITVDSSAFKVPTPFSPVVARIKQQIEDRLGVSFNVAHFVLYRDGADHLSWHTDEDIPRYGETPTIASLSFNATREFVLRPLSADGTRGDDQQQERVSFMLNHGSLLVMGGTTQRHWEHALMKSPVENAVPTPRINVTFRIVVPE
jgi:alkylated DNA repair dioxygenase AlkB